MGGSCSSFLVKKIASGDSDDYKNEDRGIALWQLMGRRVLGRIRGGASGEKTEFGWNNGAGTGGVEVTDGKGEGWSILNDPQDRQTFPS